MTRLGRDGPARLGAHAAGRARVHGRRERPLVQAHPVGLEGTREPAEVLERMELGLVGEADRGGDRERQVRVLHQRGRQPRSARRLDLLPRARRARRPTRCRRDLACAEGHSRCRALRPARTRARCRARLPCRSSRALLAAEAPFEPRVGEPVQRAELRGVVSACPGAHEARPRARPRSAPRRDSSRAALRPLMPAPITHTSAWTSSSSAGLDRRSVVSSQSEASVLICSSSPAAGPAKPGLPYAPVRGIGKHESARSPGRLPGAGGLRQPPTARPTQRLSRRASTPPWIEGTARPPARRSASRPQSELEQQEGDPLRRRRSWILTCPAESRSEDERLRHVRLGLARSGRHAVPRRGFEDGWQISAAGCRPPRRTCPSTVSWRTDMRAMFVLYLARDRRRTRVLLG